MQIHAKCTLDFEAIKALQHAAAFRGGDPKKRFLFACIMCGFVTLCSVYLLVMGSFDGYIFLLLAALVFLLDCYLIFWLPKLQYKAMRKMGGTVNTYLFGDDSVVILTESAEYKGEGEMQYTMIEKVYETSRYLFLFQTKNQAYAVCKATFAGGSAEDIRQKLQGALGKRYKICKY